MASGFYNAYKEDCLDGSVDLTSDVIKVALLSATHAFDADDNTFADVSGNEISGTGYTAGGNVLANVATVKDDANDRAYITADDAQWSGSTFTANHAVIYDTSNADSLIYSLDFGGAQAPADETFTIVWDAAGVIMIT